MPNVSFKRTALGPIRCYRLIPIHLKDHSDFEGSAGIGTRGAARQRVEKRRTRRRWEFYILRPVTVIVTVVDAKIGDVVLDPAAREQANMPC